MALVITPESPLGKEYAKWNKPYNYQPFPRMLYRAARPANGGPIEASDQVIVQSPIEEDNLISRGYFRHPTEACVAFEKRETEPSDLTAARHFEDRKLSAMAQREALAADQATDAHLPEILELPKPPKPPKRTE